MPALGAGIHVLCASSEDVDGRDKPGHDASLCFGMNACAASPRMWATSLSPRHGPRMLPRSPSDRWWW